MTYREVGGSTWVLLGVLGGGLLGAVYGVVVVTVTLIADGQTPSGMGGSTADGVASLLLVVGVAAVIGLVLGLGYGVVLGLVNAVIAAVHPDGGNAQRFVHVVISAAPALLVVMRPAGLYLGVVPGLVGAALAWWATRPGRFAQPKGAPVESDAPSDL